MKTNWQTKKLDEIGTIFNGNSINERIKKEKYLNLEEGLPFIATKDIDFQNHSIDYENGVKIPFIEKAFKIARKNSVLICAEGGSAGKKIAFNEKNICFGNKLFAIETKSDVDPKLIFYWYLTPMFFNSFKRQMNGIIGGVSIGNFKNLQIPLPPISEQRRIVKILDKVFGEIEKAKYNTEKNLQNTKDLFESYLRCLFTNSEWAEKTLKEISIEFSRGKSKHRPRNDKKLYGGKYPFIQTGDIRNSDHFIKKYSQTYNEVGLEQSKLWPKGTICITIAANIAETGILNFSSCFPDSIIGLIVDPKKANEEFVEYLLFFFKTKIKSKGKGSAQANINMGTFKFEKFPIPNILEQKTIIKKLDLLSVKTKRLEEIYRQKLANLEELKKSILMKAFAGEL